MNNLLELINYGQSYWMDNLTREKINNGELKRRVEKEGLRGVTTNPTIFNKAISNCTDYDAQILSLLNNAKKIKEVYEALAIKDVQDACDILRPVFDNSNGVDGFVSLEVSPYLAHDSAGTMNEARRLHKEVNRENCLIKIPATEEGIRAIEEMLYEGININVTLIFSVQTYKAVAEAYIKALEKRVSENKPINKVRSVASFFLSRIDVSVDNLLLQLVRQGKKQDNLPNPEELFGKAAIANAKIAYKVFSKVFKFERWNALKKKGAQVQRPLWASTGTKNPNYSDVKYVEQLIGLDTVNTMPDETIDAFREHGSIVENSVKLNIQDAEQELRYLKKYEIGIEDVAKYLLNEGLKKFKDDYDKLFKNLLEKRNKMLALEER